MIRLLGILLGSAIAVSVLIVVVGIPEFPDAPEPLADAVPDAVIEAVPGIAAETQDEIAPSSTEQDLAAEAPADSALDAPVLPESPSTDSPLESASNDSRWYAFWSPFRSEFAANGFVTQLQRTTGLDYRVVKREPGVYEVAFAYSDDEDAQQKLAQISQATGLDIPEG